MTDTQQTAAAGVDDATLHRIADIVQQRTRSHVIDPDEGEGGDEGARWLANGWIRLEVGQPDPDSETGWKVARYRLRRPFLKELETLDLAHEGLLTNELRDMSDKTLAENDKRKQQEHRIKANSKLSDSERRKKLRALQQQDQDSARQFRREQADLVLRWWEQAFDAVGVDGRPPDWPSWITDPALPARVLQHWRQVPLGRGANGQ